MLEGEPCGTGTKLCIHVRRIVWQCE